MTKQFGGKQENAGRKKRPVIEKVQSIAWVHALQIELSRKRGRQVTWNEVATTLRMSEDKSVTQRTVRYYKRGERSPAPHLRRTDDEALTVWDIGPEGLPLWKAITGELKRGLAEFSYNDTGTLGALIIAIARFHEHPDDAGLSSIQAAVKMAETTLQPLSLDVDLIVSVVCHYAKVLILNDII